MGTNYYVTKNKPTIYPPIHIGKSSGGWLFLFQDQDTTWEGTDIVWHTYPQIKTWLQKYVVDSNKFIILNEYDEIISFEEFINMVDKKQSDIRNQNNPDNFTNAKNIDGYRFTDGEFS